MLFLYICRCTIRAEIAILYCISPVSERKLADCLRTRKLTPRKRQQVWARVGAGTGLMAVPVKGSGN